MTSYDGTPPLPRHVTCGCLDVECWTHKENADKETEQSRGSVGSLTFAQKHQARFKACHLLHSFIFRIKVLVTVGGISKCWLPDDCGGRGEDSLMKGALQKAAWSHCLVI